MKELLTHLFEQKTLSRKDAENILTEIGSGKYSDAEIASFLTVFLMRTITPEELSGFRDALLKLCVRIDLSGFNTIDVCGTGGDEKNTFNISTLSAFVLAGAGEKVAKHGNYGVSSGCGSSNVLEYYGYKFSNEKSKLKKEIETAGICYFHAPLFHPAMKSVGPVRKALKLKTFFNMLGPMVNPSFPKNQLVGVYNQEVLRLYSYVYRDTGKNYIIIHGLDGYDEISLTGDFKYESNNSSDTLSPEAMGLKKVKPDELFGGNSVEEAAKIFIDILEGNGTEAQNNVVIANAAMGIKCIHQDLSIPDCVEKAKESLGSGKALNAFKTLINN
jgi:anthranilate phosphoribosyltransferase